MELKMELKIKQTIEIDQVANPIDDYLDILETNINILQFQTNFVSRYLAFRLLFITKWLDYKRAKSLIFESISFDQRTADSLWSQLLYEFNNNNTDQELKYIKNAFIGGITEFKIFVKSVWIPRLLKLCFEGKRSKKIVTPFAEMWKFKAAKPGTRLYARLTDNLSSNFSKTEKKLK